MPTHSFRAFVFITGKWRWFHMILSNTWRLTTKWPAPTEPKQYGTKLNHQSLGESEVAHTIFLPILGTIKCRELGSSKILLEFNNGGHFPTWNSLGKTGPPQGQKHYFKASHFKSCRPCLMPSSSSLLQIWAWGSFICNAPAGQLHSCLGPLELKLV